MVENKAMRNNLKYLLILEYYAYGVIHMLQNGADIETVKMLLGHTDIATTSGYNQMQKAAQ